MPMNNKNGKFKNNSTMVTDLLENNDPISKGLVEYFKKNFSINIEEIKKKYRKQKHEK